MTTIKQYLSEIDSKLDTILAAVQAKPSSQEIHQPITDAISALKTSVDAVVAAIGTDPAPGPQ